MKTFSEYHADNLTDLLTEDVSPAVAKTAALVILAKLSQSGHTLQSSDSKILSKQLFWLASLIALGIHANDPARKT
jgi:hypothetical protein